MPLNAEVNRQNHGDDGYSAKHQNRKENFDYHRESGYQNEAGAVFNFATLRVWARYRIPIGT